MAQNPPTHTEWCRLFDSAIAFKKLAPWEWMSDEDIFGVENPVTGEIGYCCIMGSLGEHLALGVYLGTQGLAGYQFIRDNAENYDADELMHLQKCLMLSFEDRDYLSTKERELIRKLGYRFRGRQAWPKFQRFDPGFYPWYLERPDIRFLTTVIEQAIEICKRVLDNPMLIDAPDESLFFVRRTKKMGQLLTWEDSWMPPQPVEIPSAVDSYEMDEQRIRDIKQRSVKFSGFMEYDYFFLPTPVQDDPGTRPFFPVVHLFVDSDSGLIVHSQIEQGIPSPKALIDIFLSFTERGPQIPQMVLVHKESIYEYLEPIAQEIGFQLIYTELLTRMTEARNSMFEFWRNKI